MRSLRSLRHDHILFHFGYIILEISHEKMWLPLLLCIGEWNACLAVSIWGKAVASSGWIAAELTCVIDMEPMLSI